MGQKRDIRYLRHAEINEAHWEACLDRAFNVRVYARMWYLRLAAPAFDALVEMGAEGAYLRVMPLVWRKKWGIYYLYQPMWTQQLGVFGETEIDAEVLSDFWEAIPARFKWWDFYGNEGEYGHVLEAKGNGVGMDMDIDCGERVNYVLKLDRAYEELAAAYDKQTKRNLKKAKDMFVGFEQVGEEHIPALLEMYRADAGRKQMHVTDADYACFERIMRAALKQNKGSVFAVKDEQGGHALCYAFFAIDRGRYYLLMPASSEEGKKRQAMRYLLDELIAHLAGTHDVELDFEGSMITGIARFYAGFGATKLLYPHIRKNSLPWYVRLFKR